MKKRGLRRRAERSRYYEELVQCRICRKRFKNVGGHLPVHGIPTADYKKRFGVDCVLSDALRVKLSEKGSRRPGGDRYEPRSKAEMLKEIREYGRKRSPLTCSFLLKKAPRLVRQAMHFFGNWSAVREVAGLRRPRRQRGGRRERRAPSLQRGGETLRELGRSRPGERSRLLEGPEVQAPHPRDGGQGPPRLGAEARLAQALEAADG